MSFSVSEEPERVLHYRKIWLNQSYLKNWRQNLWQEKVNSCMVSWNCGENALRRNIAMQQRCYIFTLYTNKVKTSIRRCMLKSVSSTVACWVMMDISRCQRKDEQKKKTFVTSWGLQKITEQDDIVRESKRVEYTLSKVYEHKTRVGKSH